MKVVLEVVLQLVHRDLLEAGLVQHAQCQFLSPHGAESRAATRNKIMDIAQSMVLDVGLTGL